MTRPALFARSFSPADTDPPEWSPLSWEARLVAGSLRSAPVTLVHGAGAADREALLTRGVMPLLARRDEDRAAPSGRAWVLPFPDRRALGRDAARAESALLIDDWAGPPLRSLSAQMERAQALRDASERDDETPARVLLVMKDFEAALEGAAGAIHPDRFWLELAQALRTRPDDLHVLLMTQEAETPSLRWLGQHLPGLGEQTLSLQSPSPGINLQLVRLPGLSGEAASKLEPTPTMPVISDGEWLEAVQGAAQRAAQRGGVPERSSAAPLDRRDLEASAAAPAAPRPAAAPPPEPVARAAPVLGPAAAHFLASAAVPAPAIVPPAAALAAKVASVERHPVAALGARPDTPPRLRLSALAVAAGAVLAVGWWGLRAPWGAPVAVARTASAVPASAERVTAQRGPDLARPAPIAAPPARLAAVTAAPMPLPVAAEPGSALRGILGRLPLLDLRGAPAQTAARLAATAQPTLALLRYDTLQKLPGSAGPEALRLVAPLFVEPVQVWVRADSAKRRLDDLEHGVIDVGGNAGDATSAAGVTEALFGARLPAARQRRLSDAQALAALQRGEVDAVLRVQASPLTALAAASVAEGGLRVLTLDRASPAGTRALRDYLSAPAPAAVGDRTLGVMSFLVVQGGADAARRQLAGAALQALCTGLPALKAAAAPVWAAVRPDIQLPTGRPYALSAERTAERADRCGPGSSEALNDTLDSSTVKGSLQ